MLQQSLANLLAAELRQHRHAPDEASGTWNAIQARRGGGYIAIYHYQKVFGALVDEVPFQFLRHLLLLNKYPLANASDLRRRAVPVVFPNAHIHRSPVRPFIRSR